MWHVHMWHICIMMMMAGWEDASLPVHERRLYEQRHSPGQDHHLHHLHNHHHHHWVQLVIIIIKSFFCFKVIPTNQVESNLSRLNFWSLAHLLLMLIVGVSQVHFHCDGHDGDYEGDYDDEDNGSYHHRHFLIMFVRARWFCTFFKSAQYSLRIFRVLR